MLDQFWQSHNKYLLGKLFVLSLLILPLLSLSNQQEVDAAPQCTKIRFGVTDWIGDEQDTAFYEVSPEYGFMNELAGAYDVIAPDFRLIHNYSGELYIYTVHHEIFSSFAHINSYKVAPDGSQVVFLQTLSSGQNLIYLIRNIDDIVPIYRTTDSILSMNWGIDKQTVYVLAANEEQNNLWKIDLNMLQIEQMNDDHLPNAWFSISPTGKYIILGHNILTVTGYSNNLVRFDIETKQLQDLTSFVNPRDIPERKFLLLGRSDYVMGWIGENQILIWTNRRTAYYEHEIYLIDIETGDFTLFSPHKFGNGTGGFKLSPDHSKIAFIQNRQATLHREIVDSKGRHYLAPLRREYQDIYILNLANRTIYPITSNYTLDIVYSRRLIWSPDSTRITFSGHWYYLDEFHTHQIKDDIFVIDVEHTYLTQLTRSPEIAEQVVAWQACP